MSERKILIDVAVMYYLEGMTQSEISKKLFVSRPTVSRLLKKARDTRVVDIKINYENKNFNALIGVAKGRFPVEEVLVVKTLSSEDATLNEVGKLAAEVLYDNLRDDAIVGLSWGTPVQRAVEHLSQKKLNNVRIVELFGSMGSSDDRSDTFSIGTRLANLVGGRLHLLPAPIYVSGEESRNDLLKNSIVSNTLGLIEQCDFILSGLNSLEKMANDPKWNDIVDKSVRSEVRSKGGVGCYCTQFYNQDGKFINLKFSNHIIGINREKLSEVKSIVIASGESEAMAIRAALKGGLINTLVTDDKTLSKVLQIDNIMVE